MWTLTGPFDGESETNFDFKKHKLLKPGTSYVIGRKNCPFVIRHPKISRQHVVLTVGEYTEEDVENPAFVPKLTVQNTCKAHRILKHEDKTEGSLAGESSDTLKHGDTLYLVHDVKITVRWEKIACCCPPTVAPVEARDCAKLGISVTWKPHPDVNYHLTSTYSLTPTVATSLLTAAQFVKPAWLTDIISHYTSLDTTDSPGQEYVVPSISKYRPTFSPALPSNLKNSRSWEPNEARSKMLKEHRVIFVGERGREVNEDYKELVKQGDASYECCAVQGGRKTLHTALAKGVGKGKKIALIADQSAMVTAVGKDNWNEMMEEAANYELRFISPEKLVLAVAHVDLSYIDCTLIDRGTTSGSASILPDVVLNTHPSEPSVAPPQPPSQVQEPAPEVPVFRKLARRAASGRPSVEPDSNVPSTLSTPGVNGEQDEPFKLRRPLVKRAILKKQIIVGIDDPSIIEGNSTTLNPIPPTNDPKSDEPYVPRRPLKRRFGTTQQPAEQPAPSQLVSSVPRSNGAEPPHKKYKALFEESDPDRIAQSLNDTTTQNGMFMGGSLTQPETPSDALTQERARSGKPLPAVLEEEEESMPGTSVPAETQAKSQGRKRKATDEDIDMDDDETRPAKRRAEGAESETQAAPVQEGASTSKRVSSKAPSSKVFTNASSKSQAATQKSAGATTDELDKDEAFLKAVASTKRGKKHEDEFDREFNNLRISKPDLQREEVEKEWAVLEDFGEEGDMRGNFMVVVEMEVFKREGTSRDAVRTTGGRLDWEGRPNFKKFKKRTIGDRPKPIETYVSEDEGLGIGDSWKTKSSQSQSRSQKFKEGGSSLKAQRKTSTPMDFDSEVEEVAAPKPKVTKAKAKTQTQRETPAKPTRPTRTTQARSQKKSQPLFMESDEDELEATMDVDSEDGVEAAIDDRDDDDDSQQVSQTLRSNPRTQDSRVKPGSRRKDAPVLMEDSDDDMAFKGFGSRRKGRR